MRLFSGRWFTTFGTMLLEQRGSRVTGSYQHRGAEGSLEGRVRGSRLSFSYEEPGERGSGEFLLRRSGAFRGTYQPRGSRQAKHWDGHRDWDGIWETTFGRVRLLQDGERVRGHYAGPGNAIVAGRADAGNLAFRYRERSGAGEGSFRLAEDGARFTGRWRPRGKRGWRPWSGHRVRPEPGVNWLVVLEAHWQRSLAEPEYAYGSMLREHLARLHHLRVRHRYFHDAASLVHWCHELRFLAEPAILAIASHGLADGLSVHGKLIDTPRVLAGLRDAESLKLLHFSSCLVGADGGRALRQLPFPVSGYAKSVDWNASALLEYRYFDLMLGRGMEPQAAAARLPRKGALGFRFFPAG